MINKVLSIAILFLMSLFLTADLKRIKSIDLETYNILKPKLMTVCDKKVFIYDTASGKICRLEENKKIKCFGSKGEGPWEYKFLHNLGSFNRKIWVSGQRGKLLYYDLEGNYLKKKSLEVSNKGWKKLIKMIDSKRWIEEKTEISKSGLSNTYIYNNKMNDSIILAKIKVNFKQFIKGKIDVAKIYTGPKVAFGKRFGFIVENNIRYKIKVFDSKNRRFCYELNNKNYKNVQINEWDLQEINREIEKTIKISGRKKSDFIIPKTSPAIHEIYSDDNDNLFVLTNEKIKNLNKLKMYDKNIKFIKDILIPRPIIMTISKNSKIYIIYEKDESYFLDIFEFKK